MNLTRKRIEEYYKDKFRQFGDTPKGVDWKDQESQNLRFKIIVDNMKLNKPFSILDVGCGTGALFEYIHRMFPDNKASYTGIDFVSEMIQRAREKFADFNNVTFLNQALEQVPEKFDFVVSSGIFNVKNEIDNIMWNESMLSTLGLMFEKCRIALIFNALTNKVDFMEDRLFYSDPVYIFTYCRDRFSRFVKLDHSYPLYEYSVCVYRADFVNSLK